MTLVLEDASGKRVRNLVSETLFPAGDNAALRGAYDRSQGTVQRLSVELFHVKRALEEVRRHRALLFGLLVLAVLLWRL